VVHALRGSGEARSCGSGTLSGHASTNCEYGGSGRERLLGRVPVIKLDTNPRSGTIDLLAALRYFQSVGQFSANGTMGQINFGLGGLLHRRRGGDVPHHRLRDHRGRRLTEGSAMPARWRRRGFDLGPADVEPSAAEVCRTAPAGAVVRFQLRGPATDEEREETRRLMAAAYPQVGRFIVVAGGAVSNAQVVDEE
jgi:hypothetical protein